MNVVRISTFDQLAALATQWDRLSRGVPFRGWAWMSGWWRHYGPHFPSRERAVSLFTLAVCDAHDVPVGIVPWYCEHSPSQGRVLKFLGIKEACADYLSVLCEPEMEDRVAAAVAEWLTTANLPASNGSTDGDSNGWDLLELTGVDAEDSAVACLVEHLQRLGNRVHRQAGPNCWRLELPDTWEQYLAMLSKSHRGHLRRLERNLLGSGRAVVRCAGHPDDLPQAERVLIDLHQRRRHSLGEPGCFASSRFTAFHRDLMPKLLEKNQLWLAWVDLDGQPAVAEYCITGNRVAYSYQTGVNPDLLKHSPGQLGNIVLVRRAIERGYKVFDLMRGDEPYKPHWRAEPRPSVEYRVVASRASSQLRHGVWLAGSSMKQWLKSGLRLVESS